jgi:hypothetical protein
VRFPNGRVLPIDSTDFHLASLGEYQNHLPEATIVRIGAEKKEFNLVVTFKNNVKLPLYGGPQQESWNAFIIPVDIKCNNKLGHGTAIFWYPKNFKEFDIEEIPTKIKRIFNRTDPPRPDKLLLSFQDKEAQSVLVSGGKGSSLAILRVIQETKGGHFLDKRNRAQQILNVLVDQASLNPLKRSTRVNDVMDKEAGKVRTERSGSIAKVIFPDPHDFDVPDFEVPEGFIVSVAALDKHVKMNQSVRTSLQQLEDVAYRRVERQLEATCKR